LAADFRAFSAAGRKLADIHLHYESAKLHPVKEQRDQLGLDEAELYRVEKMRFGKPPVGRAGPARRAVAAKDPDGRLGELSLPTNGLATAKFDKTVIQYNSHITLSGIPLEAYEYVVNGRPALEWIMERYQLSTDKDSGLTNDPNDWAREHDDPQYILNLLKRIITVSLETMKIVRALPTLKERSS
jgi:predicted helicase